MPLASHVSNQLLLHGNTSHAVFVLILFIPSMEPPSTCVTESVTNQFSFFGTGIQQKPLSVPQGSWQQVFGSYENTFNYLLNQIK